jgi:hypothetical protein
MILFMPNSEVSCYENIVNRGTSDLILS